MSHCIGVWEGARGPIGVSHCVGGGLNANRHAFKIAFLLYRVVLMLSRSRWTPIPRGHEVSTSHSLHRPLTLSTQGLGS